MAQLQINQEYKDQKMSHNNVCAKKLHEHTQEELKQLAIEARRSENPHLTRCFTNLPSLAELTDEKVSIDQAKLTPPASEGDGKKK